MARKKDELPGLNTWLKCPRCDRRDYRIRTAHNDYRCKVCGALFTANFAKQTVRLVAPREE